MKVLILGGFLGSGKTSVLMQIAREYVGENSDNLTKVVIIENEIGEIGVDDKLLSSSGYSVENMFSGCICCSLAGDIVISLQKIQEDINPELVIIESSGVGYPFNIKENVVRVLGYDCTICAVVDAKRWKRLLIPMGTMLSDQLKDSDYILVNKVDIVDEETVSFVDTSVLQFAQDAKVYNISAVHGIQKEIIKAIVS